MTEQHTKITPQTPTDAEEVRITPRPFREEQAWKEIGHTEFASGTRMTLFIGFIAFLTIVPLVQLFMPRSSYASLSGQQADTATPHPDAVSFTATVKAVSAPPATDGVYNDFLMQFHLTDVIDANSTSQNDVLVVSLGMRERIVLPSAAIRPGDRITIEALDWDKVAADFDGMNGSTLSGQEFLTMPRQFAHQIQVEGSHNTPSGRDFIATWSGIGSDLPPEHKTNVVTGTTNAWENGESLLDSVLDANNHLAKRISLYESALDDSAWLTLALKSPVQGVMAAMGVGNEKAIVGREGWLFYTPGVESLTQAGFLETAQLQHRKRTSTDQPDPRLAIIDFHRQLKARGIELIIVPAPIKPSIHPEYLTHRLDGTTPVRNPSVSQFFKEMKQAGVTVIDVLPTMMTNKNQTGRRQFLKTDTHWTPAAMEAAAAQVAQTIDEKDTISFTGTSINWSTKKETIRQFGDIATMLELPEWQNAASTEDASITRILDESGSPWRANTRAEVLLLGDSFTNIYHLGPMGWGADAGFAQHLSFQLQRPLDLLSQNDAGARASRQLLIDALITDPHRLNNTKVVIWEFAERELALGNWELMTLPKAPTEPEVPQHFTLPPTGLADGQTHTPDSAATAFGHIAKAATAGGYPAFAGKNDWLHLTAELRHLSKGKFWGEAATDQKSDPLHAIVDLHDKLAEKGVDLIFAPVPPRAIIYADTILDDVPLDEYGVPLRLDKQLQAFYEELRENGVNVIDVTDAFLRARRTDAEDGPVSCPQDTHWSPRGINITAEAIFAEVEDAEWLEEATFEGVAARNPEALTYIGDLVKRVNKHAQTTSETTIYPVAASEDGTTPFEFDLDAPVLLLSDSHGLVFSTGGDMHSENAGFGEALSAQFYFPIDRISQKGSGDNVRRILARRFIQNPSDIEKKHVIIYTFAARTLTEFNSWETVPLKQ